MSETRRLKSWLKCTGWRVRRLWPCLHSWPSVRGNSERAALRNESLAECGKVTKIAVMSFMNCSPAKTRMLRWWRWQVRNNSVTSMTAIKICFIAQDRSCNGVPSCERLVTVTATACRCRCSCLGLVQSFVSTTSSNWSLQPVGFVVKSKAIPVIGHGDRFVQTFLAQGPHWLLH
jgi:hypothetical protein